MIFAVPWKGTVLSANNSGEFQEMDAIPGSATCQPCDPRKVVAHPYLFLLLFSA